MLSSTRILDHPTFLTANNSQNMVGKKKNINACIKIINATLMIVIYCNL